MADGTAIEWPICGEDGCIGIRLATGLKCLAHVGDRERDAAFNQLGETGAIDARGVLITGLLLEQLLAAAMHDAENRPVFTAVDFEQATFDCDTPFLAWNFKGGAWFTKATFKGEAAFGGATFEGYAGFAEAIFEGAASFTTMTFEGEASFGGATFKDRAEFTKTTFQRDALFDGAAFQGDARFQRAAFHRDTRFGGATFQGEAWFKEATFDRGWVQHGNGHGPGRVSCGDL